MATKGEVRMSIDKMKSLLEGLKHVPEIQVGVFEGKSARSDKGLTNADLAMIHEYGSPEHNIPPRSMLKVPISEHAKEIMEPFKNKAEAFLATAKLMDVWKSIGVACEKIVQQAFDTGGFGKWPSLKYATLLAKAKGSLKKRKGTLAQIYAGQVGQGILINTGQLRRAFSSRVRMRF